MKTPPIGSSPQKVERPKLSVHWAATFPVFLALYEIPQQKLDFAIDFTLVQHEKRKKFTHRYRVTFHEPASCRNTQWNVLQINQLKTIFIKLCLVKLKRVARVASSASIGGGFNHPNQVDL
jgi:hypothetical protein